MKIKKVLKCQYSAWPWGGEVVSHLLANGIDPKDAAGVKITYAFRDGKRRKIKSRRIKSLYWYEPGCECCEGYWEVEFRHSQEVSGAK